METNTDGNSIQNALPPSIENGEEGKSEQETQNNGQNEKNGSTNNGYQEFVDLSTLPDEIRGPVEARINVLTKKMGNQDRRHQSELSEWRKIAADQSKLIDELRNNQIEVVDHLENKSLADAEARIMDRMEKAHESGDTKAFLAAQKDLTNLSAKKMLVEERRKSQPKQESKNEQRQESFNSDDIVNDAVADGTLDADSARAVNAWMNEKDDGGNLVRPWAYTKNKADPLKDPVFKRAFTEMAAIFNEEDETNPWLHKTAMEKLAEMDRRMGVRRNNGTQTVMGGNLTSQRKTSKLSLSPEAEQIAKRTQFAGRGKSDAEHIEAYRKQMDSISKGVRK